MPSLPGPPLQQHRSGRLASDNTETIPRSNRPHPLVVDGDIIPIGEVPPESGRALTGSFLGEVFQRLGG